MLYIALNGDGIWKLDPFTAPNAHTHENLWIMSLAGARANCMPPRPNIYMSSTRQQARHDSCPAHFQTFKLQYRQQDAHRRPAPMGMAREL
jgi:hypothetical protein